jgi:hypothetical protein
MEGPYARSLHRAILAILTLNALWVLTVPSFPTLDGWSHLHTARMLLHGPPEGVFCSNPGIVPNRIGHGILAALQVILPAMAAERVLLALIIFGIGAGAYQLARAFGGRSPVILLILPFTVNFLLVLGFHNFLLGLAFAMFLSAWWVGLTRITWPVLIGYAATTFLLFYTHTTALVLFFLITGAHELACLAGPHMRTVLPLGNKRWSGTVLFAAFSLPAGLLFLYFNASQATAWGAVDPEVNLRELFNLRSILLYNQEAESKFTYAVKLILTGTFVLGMIHLLSRPDRFRPHHAHIPLLVALVLFALYFILPDSSGYASYITVRLQLMALIMVIIWLAARPLPLLAVGAPVIMILLLQFARNNHIEQAMAPIAEQRDQVLDAARHLPPGSVVLPISSEENWLLDHVASLLAVENDVILLDNYEAMQSYFPLVLCPDVPGPIRDHMARHDRCLAWLNDHLDQRAAPAIDHIVLLGYSTDSTSCTATALRGILQERAKLSYTNAYAKIYALHP